MREKSGDALPSHSFTSLWLLVLCLWLVSAAAPVNAASSGTVVAWGDFSHGQTTVPAGLSGVTAIAGGQWHTVALKNDNTVVGWGNNAEGETTGTPSGFPYTATANPVILNGAILSEVTAIAAGRYHTMALKIDHTVVAWGDNSSGETTVPVGLSGVTAIAAGSFPGFSGYSHSVALKSDGTVVAWGNNTSGQTNVPLGLSSVKAIAAGGYHTLALKSDGTVIAWGGVTVPAGLSGVTAIAAGAFHAVALKSDGTVVAWGFNGDGQTSVPAGLSGVTDIAAGGFHTVALRSDGTVVTWGNNDYGQTNVPAGLSGVTAIAAGGYHTVALVGTGATAPTVIAQPVSRTVNAGQHMSFTVVATGTAPLNYQWHRDGTSLTDATNATYNLRVQTNQAGSYTVVVSNATGSVTSAPAVLTVNAPSVGTVAAWGYNSAGQTIVPAGLDAVTAIAAGEHHTVALKNDGTVVAWGDNGYGQTTIPTGLTGVTAIAAGYQHTIALKTDGTVAAWGGYNGIGVATIPAGISGVTAIAGGGYHTVALKSDGTVIAWGDNAQGQTNIPAGLSGVVDISAGRYHTVAPKNDGTMVAWGGDNTYGQRTVPVGLSGITAIAAGEFHTVALKSDGTVVAWGAAPGPDNYGQATVPAGLSGVTAIAAGYLHTVALKNDGTVVAWGYNAFGQTTVPTGLSEVTAIAGGGYHTVALVASGPSTAPTITMQPQNLAMNVTSNASLTVTATGTAPLAYQWRKDGVIVTGTTSASLMLSNVQTNQAGNYTVVITNAYGSVTSSVAVLTVNRLAQTISFAALAPKRIDDAAFTLNATSSSGLPVSYTSSNPGVATVSGNTVTITGIGSTTITASGAEDATYLPAGDMSQTLIVTGMAPGITSQPTNLTVSVTSNAIFTVAVTGTAPLSYHWNRDGVNVTDATNASLTLSNVQTNQTGNYTIVITNAYGSVTSSVAVLTVNRLAQTISFGSLPAKQLGDAPFTLNATTSSGLPVSYSSSNPLVATVSGNTVSVTGIGNTVIKASRAGDATYLPAADVSQTLNVIQPGSGSSAPTITTTSTSNTLTLYWPDSATGYRPESTSSLPPITWNNVTGTFQTNGGFISIIIPITGTQNFYRLSVRP